MSQNNLYNIGNSERVMRIVLGVGLIVDVLHGSGPLGLAALIPLVSIYPLMTGFLGFDPLYGAMGYSTVKTNASRKVAARKRFARVAASNIGTSERVMRIVLGLGLIADVMVGAGPLGLAMLLPLISIYPLMTGFLGYDPIYSAIGYSSVRTVQKRGKHTPRGGFFNGALHS